MQQSGYWGTSAACDIPYRTIENMLQNIQKLEKVVYLRLIHYNPNDNYQIIPFIHFD